MSFYARFGKRLFDFSLSLVGLILLAPLAVLLGTLIWLDDGRPILFVQTRIGRGGISFPMYKLRTMVLGAELGGPITIAGDSRLTRSGRFLRRFKLDELPQLWNVLRGEMSFVGPRPDVPGFADSLEGEHRRILDLLPGITGPATLEFANEEEILARVPDPDRYNRETIFAEKVLLNLKYLDEISFGVDLRCLARTFGLWKKKTPNS